MHLTPTPVLCAALPILAVLGACSSGSSPAPVVVTASMTIARSPVPGTLFAAPDTRVQVQLDRDVDPSLITSDIFFVEGPSGIVPASIAYDASTRTATLTPDSPWTLDVRWTSTFGSVTQLAGPAVARSWQFETRMGAWTSGTALYSTPAAIPTHTNLDVDDAGTATAVVSYRISPAIELTLLAADYVSGWQPAVVMPSYGKFKDVQLSVAPTGHASVLGSRDDQLVWIQRPNSRLSWFEQILPGSFLPPEFGVQIEIDERERTVAIWSAKGLSAVMSASHDGLEWSDDRVLTSVARSAHLTLNRRGQGMMASTNPGGLLTRRYTEDGDWLGKEQFAIATGGLLDVGMSESGEAWVAAINNEPNDIHSVHMRRSHPTEGWSPPQQIIRHGLEEFVLGGDLSVGPNGHAAVVWHVSKGPGLGIDIFVSVYDLATDLWSAPHPLGEDLPGNSRVRTQIATDPYGNVTAIYWIGDTTPRTHTARFVPTVGWRKTASFDGSYVALVSDRFGRTQVVGWRPDATSGEMVLFARTFE